MVTTEEHHLGRTYRSFSGNRRVTYRPDWCKESPWVSYYKGTAGIHFPTLQAAQGYHNKLGDFLVITTGS